jgi:hypothetical protein
MAKAAKKKAATKKAATTKAATKKPATKKPVKKKLTLGKETVRTLTDKGMRKVPGQQRAPDSYMTCNMKCNSDPSACGC